MRAERQGIFAANKDEPAEIDPAYFQDEDMRKIVQYFTTMLEEAGLLRKVEGQTDLTGLNYPQPDAAPRIDLKRL